MGSLYFWQNSQKISNFRAISPRERGSVNFLTKKASQPPRNLVIFKSKWYQKQWFQDQTLEKYIKSKNSLKRAQGAYNQDILPIFIFDKIHKKIQNSERFSPGKDPRWFFFDEKGVSAPRNIVMFSKNCIKKQWLHYQKFEKYIKSKNTLKSAPGAFNQEIWVI